MILHGYFRSSAAWRVRIACALKGIEPEVRVHNLRNGEQFAPSFTALNPQGLVPALELDDGEIVTQSLAIIGLLDRAVPEPALLPADPVRRAKVEAFALTIACDTHPLQNLKVLNRLRAAGWTEAQVNAWIAAAINDGLGACEALIAREPGPFCFGDRPTLADLCLIPQLGSARRFAVDLAPYPRLVAIDAHCASLPAFAASRPDRQVDAV